MGCNFLFWWNPASPHTARVREASSRSRLAMARGGACSTHTAQGTKKGHKIEHETHIHPPQPSPISFSTLPPVAAPGRDALDEGRHRLVRGSGLHLVVSAVGLAALAAPELVSGRLDGLCGEGVMREEEGGGRGGDDGGVSVRQRLSLSLFPPLARHTRSRAHAKNNSTGTRPPFTLPPPPEHTGKRQQKSRPPPTPSFPPHPFSPPGRRRQSRTHSAGRTRPRAPGLCM